MLTTLQLLNGVSASALLAGGDEPPVLTDPHWYDVVYLNNFNEDAEVNYGGSLSNYTSDAVLTTLGTPAVEGQALVGGGYINVNHNIDCMGISDFTYEAFLYRDLADDSTPPRFTSQCGFYGHLNSSGYIYVRLFNDGSDRLELTSPVLYPLGEWVYVCVERTGSTVRLYQGTLASGTATMVASGTFEFPLAPMNFPQIVGNNNAGNWFESGKGGRADDVRLTTVARYSTDTNYPIPSVPYPQSDPVETGFFPKSGKMLHFDASIGAFSDDSGTIPCVDGDPVALWENQGFYPDAKQTTPANRPTFKTGGHKGFPYIKCEQTIGQFFEDFVYKEPYGLTANSSKTIFAVLDNLNRSVFHALIGSTVSSGGKIGVYFRPTNGQHIHPFKSAWRMGTFQDFPFLLALNIPVWSSLDIRVNDSQTSFGATGNFTSTEVPELQFLRSVGLGASESFDGHLYEFIFYTGGMSDSMFNDIVSYLISKYSLTNPNELSALKPYIIVDETAQTNEAHITALKPYTILKET